MLRLVADGLANKQIGRALGITERTVKAHLGKRLPPDRGGGPHERRPVGPRPPRHGRLERPSSTTRTRDVAEQPPTASVMVQTVGGCAQSTPPEQATGGYAGWHWGVPLQR